LIEGAKDGSALGFTLGREVGIQEGTVVGASLGLRIGDALGNDDGLIEEAKEGTVLG
jgi:phage tail tape-measure protein